MAVVGAHMLVYSPEAEAVRAAFRDIFGWRHVDAGGGWLIFAMPPSELGVHPGASTHHEISLVCDDLAATVSELRAKGLTFDGEPEDRGFGITIHVVLPGNLRVLLYEPRHPMAIDVAS